MIAMTTNNSTSVKPPLWGRLLREADRIEMTMRQEPLCSRVLLVEKEDLERQLVIELVRSGDVNNKIFTKHTDQDFRRIAFLNAVHFASAAPVSMPVIRPNLLACDTRRKKYDNRSGKHWLLARRVANFLTKPRWDARSSPVVLQGQKML